MTRVIVETSKAAAIQAARQWAKEASADVAWVHVFSLATDLSVVSFQSLTSRLA